MKGDEKVIKHLQRALTMELTTVHQYLLHKHVLLDWGLDRLGAKLDEEAQEELGHANKLLERMMFLDADPDVSTLDQVARAQTVRDMFEVDLKGEYEARKYYTTAAMDCEKAGDLGSRDLFHALIHDEEGHIDWIETQLGLLDRLGEQGYYQLHTAAAGGDI